MTTLQDVKDESTGNKKKIRHINFNAIQTKKEKTA